MQGQDVAVGGVQDDVFDDEIDTDEEDFEEDPKETAKRLKKKAKVFDAAKTAAKAAAKVLDSMSEEPPQKAVDILEPARQVLKNSIFGPDDLENPEENMVAYIERLYSANHTKTAEGNKAAVGYLSVIPYDELSFDRIRDEYGGGRYLIRISGSAGGKRNRYIGAKTINIAGPPKNPGEEEEQSESEMFYPYPLPPGMMPPPGMPGFAPPFFPGGYPYQQPPADDKTAELFASMSQQQSNMFQLMMTRMDQESRREEQRLQTEREDRKGEASVRSAEMKQQLAELKLQADKDREDSKNQHELELKKLEMANSDRLKQMEIMMTALKPDQQISAFTTMFSSVVELVRATADTGEKSTLGQVLDTVKEAVPAFLGKGGAPPPPIHHPQQPVPALQQQQGPQIPPEVLAQKFREDAYARAVHHCPAGHQILENGETGNFYIWPLDQPVPPGMVARYPNRQEVPAQELPQHPPAQEPQPQASPKNYHLSGSLLVVVLEKLGAEADPLRAPFDLIAEQHMTDEVRERIGKIFELSEADAVLMNLAQFIASNGGVIPENFVQEISTQAGIQWMQDFLFACQHPTYDEALKESQPPPPGSA